YFGVPERALLRRTALGPRKHKRRKKPFNRGWTQMNADRRHVIRPQAHLSGKGMRKHNVLIIRVNPCPSAVLSPFSVQNSASRLLSRRTDRANAPVAPARSEERRVGKE